MNTGIIESAVPVTLLGGGTVYDGDIVEALALAPVCVAADSGARHALAARSSTASMTRARSKRGSTSTPSPDRPIGSAPVTFRVALRDLAR